MTEERATLLEFPCEFPIKIMGVAQEGFAEAMLKVILQYAPDYIVSSTEIKTSRTGKFVSLTCTINAISQPQLDELYREINSHPMVSMTL